MNILQINKYFVLELENIESDQIEIFLSIIKKFKKCSFIPNFRYDSFSKKFYIKSICELITYNDLKKKEIQRLNKIISTLDSFNINLNFLENIPIFRDDKHIFFINFLHATVEKTRLNTNLNNLNHEIFKKWLFDYYNISSDIIYILINTIDYEMNRLMTYLNSLSEYNIEFHFIIPIQYKYYEELKIKLQKSNFNSYIIFLINNNEYKNLNYQMYNLIFSKLNILQFNYLISTEINKNISKFIIDINHNPNINILTTFNKNNILIQNSLLDQKCIETIVTKQLFNDEDIKKSDVKINFI